MSLPPMNELLAFQKTASRLSFKKASDELNLTPSTVSHLVRSLEERLKTRLLNRTTRSVSLTEPGQKLFGQLNSILNNLTQAVDELDTDDKQPNGTIRISVNEIAAPILLDKLGKEFQETFPNVHVELIVDNRLIDTVAEGFDAGIRLRDTVPQDMVAVPVIKDFRFVVAAATTYIEKHGLPTQPSDLLEHNCIGFRFQSGRLYEWEFKRKDKRMVIDVKGTMTTNNPGLIMKAVKNGVGIGHIAEPLIKKEVESKELTVLLDDWNPGWPGLYLYFPRNRHMPSGLRAVIDTLRDN